MNWQVYIIRCSDRSLYTGITNDLQRRWRQHASRRGAKYFRARHPVEVVYLEPGHDRSSASRREADIKRLARADKERLIRSGQNQLHRDANLEVLHASEETDETGGVDRHVVFAAADPGERHR